MPCQVWHHAISADVTPCHHTSSLERTQLFRLAYKVAIKLRQNSNTALSKGAKFVSLFAKSCKQITQLYQAVTLSILARFSSNFQEH